MTDQTQPDLMERAVLLQIRLGCLSPTRDLGDGSRAGIDVEATATTATDKEKNAKKDRIRVRERLYDGWQEYKAVGSEHSKIRAWLDSHTLPSPLRGVYLVPAADLAERDAQLDGLAADLNLAVEAFVASIDDRRAHDRERLGPLYDADSYPSADEARKRFYFRRTWLAISSPTALDKIDTETARKAREAFDQAMADATDNARQLLRVKLAEMIQHMSAILAPSTDGTKRRFRSANLDNLREFLAELPKLDTITQDADLAQLAARASSVLAGIPDAESLRTDHGLRAVVSERFAALGSDLAQLVEQAPRRQIVLD